MSLSPLQRFIFFLLLALSFRIWTFFPSVIDHDESTYIIIADQLLAGKWPYIANIDVKPPAIYLLFAATLHLFNDIVAIRILAALIVGATGYLAYRTHRNLFGVDSVAMLTGILFVFCASLHKWSWAANTEIFFVFCSLWVFHFIMQKNMRSNFVWAGIILGVGFLFKYQILFDVVPYLAIYFALRTPTLRRAIYNSAKLGLSFLVPIVGIVLFYYVSGHFDALYFATIEIPSRYSSVHSMGKALALVGEFYLSFLPVSLAFIAGFIKLWQHEQSGSRWRMLWVIWTCFTWTGVLITGKYYYHYLYQVLLPFTFLVGTYFTHEPDLLQKLQNIKKGPGYLILLSLLICLWANQFVQLHSKPDQLPEITAFIKKDLPDGEFLYTNDKNILYYLCGTDPPTKYVHTSLLYKADLIEAYAIDTAVVFQEIIAKRPLYYVIHDQAPNSLKSHIAQEYELAETFGSNTLLYRRRD